MNALPIIAVSAKFRRRPKCHQDILLLRSLLLYRVAEFIDGKFRPEATTGCGREILSCRVVYLPRTETLLRVDGSEGRTKT
jgi:hypothetical protein